MAYYGQTTETGEITSYLKADFVDINNSGMMPDIVFREYEKRLLNGEELTSKPTNRDLKISFDNPELDIPYVDENFNQTAQTFKAKELAAKLVALYIYVAEKKDAETAPA